MKFIGIDLAWTYRNETGVCVMSDGGTVEHLDSQVYSDEDLLDIIKAHGEEELCIAIDAPLVVNNEGGSRSAERELMRAKVHGHRLFAFNSNRNFLVNTYGSIRGETLMDLIRKEMPNTEIGPVRSGSHIVETFPTGVCCGLFPEIYPVRYKRKRRMSFEETCSEMERLMVRFREVEAEESHVSGLAARLDVDTSAMTRKMHKHTEDKIDAFLCAYGMYSIHRGIAEGRMFGNVDEGFIMFPVKQ